MAKGIALAMRQIQRPLRNKATIVHVAMMNDLVVATTTMCVANLHIEAGQSLQLLLQLGRMMDPSL